MSNNSSDENSFIAIVVIGLGIGAFLIFKFANAIDVNVETAFTIISRGFGVLVISIVLLKFDVISWSAVLPALLSGLVWAFLPVFDYWSVKETGLVQYGMTFGDPKWYSFWYSQTALVAFPSFVGYGLRYTLSR